jgi:selenocysteine lyase/cysteine desulfurase
MAELRGRHTRRAALTAVGLAPATLAIGGTTRARPPGEYGFAAGLAYLNTASLGPTPRSIREVMDRAWTELETNPVRMAYGQGEVLAQTDVARGQIAGLLGCGADELLLTRSTTDAMNILAAGARLRQGDRVLTTDQEHEGGAYCWTNQARRLGLALDVIPITPDDHDAAAVVARFAAGLRPTTRVISVSHVISATGHRMPVETIAALARSKGVVCVVDGAQAWGQIPVDVKAIGCHAYATTGHKWMMGPKGCGVLYLSPDAHDLVQPVQLEDGHRFVSNATGVGCLPLAIGLGAAAEAMRRRGLERVATHNMRLRNLAYEGLARIPGLKLAGAPPGHPMGTALIAARLPDQLDSNLFRQVMYERHRVVVKMAEKRWFNGFRLSPHLFNSEADIDRALRAIRTELG